MFQRQGTGKNQLGLMDWPDTAQSWKIERTPYITSFWKIYSRNEPKCGRQVASTTLGKYSSKDQDREYFRFGGVSSLPRVFSYSRTGFAVLSTAFTRTTHADSI